MNATSYRRIAVLDIGKTNAKVVVLDSETGAEIAVLKRPNIAIKTGRYPHYDVEALWSFALDALKSLAREPGFDAISITTHGASAALLGRDGALAMPRTKLQMLAASLSPQHGERESRSAAARLFSREREILSGKREVRPFSGDRRSPVSAPAARRRIHR